MWLSFFNHSHFMPILFYLVQFSRWCKFKTSEAGSSKQVKAKDLSSADKILVINEFDKKDFQSVIAEKFKIFQSQVLQILKSKEKLWAAHCSNKNPTGKRARKSSQEDVLLQCLTNKK